ncbi:MAG: N-glycosylase/DNA lyase [Bacteroidetes bacterium]|nr:N-glycosylase/DNA lyase [Bacteroidota bacterium]
MSEQQHRYRHIEELHAAFEERKTAIRRRLDDFVTVRPQEYFHELAYCILTPQSSATHAAAAIEVLRSLNCWNDREILTRTLSRPQVYVRFHNTKAERLAEAYTQFPGIMYRLKTYRSSHDIRGWLVENVRGLGWKEASHFLRNIGHRNLAILDRHILKNLRKHGVLASLPKTLTRRNYLAIEQHFSDFAERIGLTMDELDLLFWSTETGQILK